MEFIHFGNDWFAENRTSSHHMSRRFGQQFPVLYVEVPGLRKPQASGRDLRKAFEKVRRTFQPPERVGPQFWRMTLAQIPLRRFAAVRWLNAQISKYVIRKALRGLGFKETVAWFHIPHAGFLAKSLGETVTVYYCVDDFSKIPNVDGQSVQAIDDFLTKSADIVFACNEPLVEARRHLNGNIFVSPHGVDAEVFALAQSAETPLPEEVKGMQRPIIGSWGLIDERVDLGMVEYIAKARPEWTILMLGRPAVDVSALKALPNVQLLGVKPYKELASWAKAMDVCILPYVQTPLILQSSPLKLREYLAAGKPIVSVPLPEATMLGEMVKTAVDGEGFVQAIEASLGTETPEMVARRQAAVAGNTWDATVANALDKVRATMKRKQAAG